jgi:hypothetical protein
VHGTRKKAEEEDKHEIETCFPIMNTVLCGERRAQWFYTFRNINFIRATFNDGLGLELVWESKVPYARRGANADLHTHPQRRENHHAMHSSFAHNDSMSSTMEDGGRRRFTLVSGV